MAFVLPPDNRNCPDRELLEDLRAVASRIGTKPVTWRCYEDYGRFDCETLRRRFGSWNKALTAAGLEVSKRHAIPTDDLLGELASTWMRLGEPPSRTAFQLATTGVSTSTIENRFGSWRKALEAVVESMSNESLPLSTGNVNPTSSKFASTPRTPDLRLRWKVMQRDRFRCVKCGACPSLDASVVLHVDHVRPWVAGGPTVLENLQTLCDRCNLGKGAIQEG